MLVNLSWIHQKATPSRSSTLTVIKKVAGGLEPLQAGSARKPGMAHLGHGLGDGQVVQLVDEMGKGRLHMEAQLLACTRSPNEPPMQCLAVTK